MSQFVEVKTADLVGPALDWAVGVAEGNPMRVPVSDVVWSDWHGSYAPSINWTQGGPLRDKHRVDITEGDHDVSASILTESCECVDASGPTALIALCRAIVAAKLGDVVQVPAELVVEG